MKKPNITPGEWIAVQGHTLHVATTNDEVNKDGFVCLVCEHRTDERMAANAKAIAALPLYLEALEKCAEVPDTAGILGMIRRESRKALTAAGYKFAN